MSFSSIKRMKKIGQLVALCLYELRPLIVPGISTLEIEEYVRNFQIKNKIKNSQFGYFNFPGLVCTSINEEVCHGIPKADRILNEGDIISCDVTFNLDGYHGDSCITYPVGSISKETQELLDVSKRALDIGIEAAIPGNKICDIGYHIEKFISFNGYSVIKEYTGHGIGTEMHQLPIIPHYYDPDHNAVIKPGMMFTIEPIIVKGDPSVSLLPDDWTSVTIDKSWSAQFEHTILITNNGNEILTKINE